MNLRALAVGLVLALSALFAALNWAAFTAQGRLTVKMTAEICEAAASFLRIHSLEGSLVIEWE